MKPNAYCTVDIVNTVPGKSPATGSGEKRKPGTLTNVETWNKKLFYSTVAWTIICLKDGWDCTDEISFSDVNSPKKFSRDYLYMCLKMYCHKYVVNLIYFYSCGPGVAI